MTKRELQILENLGFDISRPKEEILSNLIRLADYLYKEVALSEKQRFLRDIDRLKKHTN